MLSLEIIRKFKDLCAWLGVAAIIIDMYKHFQRFGTQTNKMHNNLDSAWAARLSVNIIIFFSFYISDVGHSGLFVSFFETLKLFIDTVQISSWQDISK